MRVNRWILSYNLMIFDDLAGKLDLCEYLHYSRNDFTRFLLTVYISSILWKNTTKVSVAIFSSSNSTLLLLLCDCSSDIRRQKRHRLLNDFSIGERSFLWGGAMFPVSLESCFLSLLHLPLWTARSKFSFFVYHSVV